MRAHNERVELLVYIYSSNWAFMRCSRVKFTCLPEGQVCIFYKNYNIIILTMYRVLVGKPEGKRPLRRPRCRWEDNIKMDLQIMGCRGMDWIGLAQDRDRWWALVKAVMNLRVQ
jgi:hypothetical protein